MSREPVFALSFDPRALTDLLQAPGDIRDLALAQLQDIVNAELFGAKLTGDLSGFRKVVVDSRKEWRMVYTLRPAPTASAHHNEIHVVAVRLRGRNDVYDTVGARLGMVRRPVSARTHAARSRPPQLTTSAPVPKPGPLPAAPPGLPRPASSPAHPVR
ncbi:type II toxin-antitoxin system RelE/ParE family toxin [Streptomyces sp. NPDC096310]|uniref:type II toxin-antitoxin system RelE family toxin n=1 Tax=Streptomyces sp. NPDC096310 TaxID=3366082 RepID=UPI00381D75E3